MGDMGIWKKNGNYYFIRVGIIVANMGLHGTLWSKGVAMRRGIEAAGNTLGFPESA